MSPQHRLALLRWRCRRAGASAWRGSVRGGRALLALALFVVALALLVVVGLVLVPLALVMHAAWHICPSQPTAR